MIEDYNKAHRRGEREYRRCISAGKYPYLPALDDFLDVSRQQNQVPLGVTEIPLSMIVGTKTAGRQNAFAGNFMPLLSEKSEFALKWANLYDAQMNEGLRDPILAYEYLNRYYVQEGNKRVSVLKAVGAYAISADVIRILPEHTDSKDIQVYYEFLDFYEVTKLNAITFSEPGRYAELASLFGQGLDKPWDPDLVSVLRSAFLTFTDLYEERRGDSLGITRGDAFLLYLRVFSLDSLLSEDKGRLKKRMEKVWTEFLTATNKEGSIELVEMPEDLSPERISLGIKKIFSIIPAYTERKPLKAAFLYEKDTEHSWWNYGHDLGRTEVEETLEGIVRTVKFEHCDSDELTGAALIKAIGDGCRIIFTTSSAMMPAAVRVALSHPEVHILNCSINLTHNSVRTYYSRMYEAKFLMGALAASLCDSDRIGYVADYAVYGSIANINAFAFGAAMVRPDVKIILKWSTQKNVNWKKDFSWENISVISGPDFIRPDSEEREYGLYYKKGDTLSHLAAPIWQWGKYYELILRTVLSGTYTAQLSRADQAINYWYGMASGVIDVILSKNLSYHSDRLIGILRREIISGDLQPFVGELRSQDGSVMAPAGILLSHEDIIRMNWLAENVIGEIPSLNDTHEDAQKTLIISGIKEAGGQT